MNNDARITLEQTSNSLKPYRKPELEELGDLRDITLGTSHDPWCGTESGQTPCPAGSHASASKKFPSLLDTQKTLKPKKKN